MRLLRPGGNVYNRAIHIRFDLLWEINLLDMPKKVVPFSGIGRWVLTGAELTGYTVGMLMALYRNGEYDQNLLHIGHKVCSGSGFSRQIGLPTFALSYHWGCI